MIALVLYIIETALEIVKAQVSGAKVNIPEALVRIVRAGYQAYQKEVGQPLDPDKLKPYAPLD